MTLRAMRPMLPICLAGGLLFAANAGPLHSAGEVPALPAAADLPARIRELEHPDYVVRKEATQALAKAGAEALEPLKGALGSGSLELRLRVVDLLGRIYSQGEDATFEAAELALEQVRSDAGGSLAALAEQVLASHFEIRQKFAAERIRDMGGSVLYRPEIPGVQTIAEDDDFDADHSQRRIVDAVVIGQDWTGGDEGLKQIRRLTKLRAVYRVRKAPVSDEAIKALHDEMPQVSIESRGSAYFGINPATHPRGCVILRVAPGSAAEKAGLLINDLVTHFDGKPVTSQENFIDLIAEKLPGDTVPLIVERKGQVMDLKAELSGWPKDVAP